MPELIGTCPCCGALVAVKQGAFEVYCPCGQRSADWEAVTWERYVNYLVQLNTVPLDACLTDQSIGAIL